MEGGCQKPPLLGRNDSSILQSCQHLHVWTNSLDEWSTNEDAVKSDAFLAGLTDSIQSGHIQVHLEAVPLAAEGVALNRDIHEADGGMAPAADVTG